MTRVYIGSLGDNASKREIENEFEYFGRLKDVWVARNPPGFAFCIFEDRRDAEDAVRELDGKLICGTRVRVEFARGPVRGGRAVRQGMSERCYTCDRPGHFARECTRQKSSERRSRSRSPRNNRSRSKSRSPRRRRSRSNEKQRRSQERSRSRERKSPSPFKERRKERSWSRSVSPKQEKASPKDDRNNGDGMRSPTKSRSRSPDSPRAAAGDS